MLSTSMTIIRFLARPLVLSFVAKRRAQSIAAAVIPSIMWFPSSSQVRDYYSGAAPMSQR